MMTQFPHYRSSPVQTKYNGENPSIVAAMTPKYRYRFPLSIVLFKWGIQIECQSPIVKIRQPRPTDPEDSMLIYIGMFDEDN